MVGKLLIVSSEGKGIRWSDDYLQGAYRLQRFINDTLVPDDYKDLKTWRLDMELFPSHIVKNYPKRILAYHVWTTGNQADEPFTYHIPEDKQERYAEAVRWTVKRT
jgi:hypothetical protein